MTANRAPAVAYWLPYALVVIPSLCSVAWWLVAPGWSLSGWLALPAWVVMYYVQRTVLRTLFVRRGLD